jgi:hypothetical protein
VKEIKEVVGPVEAVGEVVGDLGKDAILVV